MSRKRPLHPRLVPSLAAAILLPLFVYLGIWQLQRAAEKRLLQAQYDSRAAGPAIKVEARLEPPAVLQFYRVVATGYYETDRQILLDNRLYQGQAGYDVITPLRLQDSDVRLLVNRGWIPLGVDREHLPAVDTPQTLQEITGVAEVPDKNVFMLAKPAPLDHGWQTVWENMDMARFAAAVPYPVQPVVVRLDPDSPAGGFIRDWRRPDTKVAMHQGYAFQWFMLAGTVIAIYLYMILRGANTDGQEQKKS
ncbi:MAG: SURF1 family protein [Sulfuricaulis sp.]